MAFYADPPNPGDMFPPDYNPLAPTFGPRPPFPPCPPWNDTEHAWMPVPGQPCCPDDESACLCLTSADVSAWDSVFDTVSSCSGQWGGDLSDFSARWESTYSSVYDNSARWDSAANQDISDLSARWESAYSAVSACQALIDSYSGQDTIKTKAPIVGDGTTENPITLEDEIRAKISNAYSLVHELIYQLYANVGDKIAPELQEWLHKDSLDGINKELREVNVSAAIFENEVVKLWEAIKMLNGGKAIKLVSYEYAPDMTYENVADYFMPDTIYYNEE